MENRSKFLYQKKLLVFGSEGVGKTSLSSILNRNVFNEEEASTEESK
jgi:GTPase SAR1 family protein